MTRIIYVSVWFALFNFLSNTQIDALDLSSLNIKPDFFMDSEGLGNSCGDTETDSNGYIYSHKEAALTSFLGFGGLTSITNYDDDTDCTLAVNLQSLSGAIQILLQFEVDIALGTKDSSCDKLSIYSSLTPSNASLVHTFCGPEANVAPLVVPANVMSLHFKANGDAVAAAGFKILYSAFYTATAGACDGTDFLCDTDRCMKSVFKCDGATQCIDGMDETEASGCTTLQNVVGALLGFGMTTIIIIVVVVIVSFILFIVLIYCCCFKKKTPQPMQMHAHA